MQMGERGRLKIDFNALTNDKKECVGAIIESESFMSYCDTANDVLREKIRETISEIARCTMQTAEIMKGFEGHWVTINLTANFNYPECFIEIANLRGDSLRYSVQFGENLLISNVSWNQGISYNYSSFLRECYGNI